MSKLVFYVPMLIEKSRVTSVFCHSKTGVITFRESFSSTIFKNVKYLKTSGYRSMLYKSIKHI